MKKSITPKLQLLLTFLPGYVQHTLALTKAVANLQKQCRFSNSRCTAYKDQRARYSAAAEHAVKFPHSG